MKSILVILFLILTPVSAFADGWSFGVDGGLAVPTQNYFPTNSGDPGTLYHPYFNALEASEGYIISVYALHTVWKPWLKAGLLGTYDTTGTSATSPFSPSSVQELGSNRINTGVKANLGMALTWAIMPYFRVNPWTFGNWTPFLGVGVGWSWNQWNTQGTPSYSASVSNALVTHVDLGVDYAVTKNFSLESLIGFTENDPLGSVNLPQGQGGMDQDFQMSLFFVEIGVNFSL